MAARQNKRGWWIVALVLAVTTALAGVTVVALTGADPAEAVTLEPAGVPGADPFSDSVAIGPAVAFPGNVQAINVSVRKKFTADPKTRLLVATGTTPGLYGGSNDQHVCDPQKLVTFLGAHSDKAAAWAGVLGIRVNDIASYVETLTPVVLTSDTLVTNHGFRDGRATSLHSVLQAGTAVMVDGTGTPRVKCNCGNPLTPAAPIAVTRTRGTAWPGYTSQQVTVVRAAPTAREITLVNVKTGINYSQATGGGGAGGQFIGNKSADLLTSADGTAWTKKTSIPDWPQALVSGGGKLLAIAFTPTGTIVWSVLQGGSRHIAMLPENPSSIAYGDGKWVLTTVQTNPSTGYGDGSIYTSTDATNWTKADVTVRTAGYGAGTGNRVPVAYGDGMWLAVGSQPSSVYTSTDGSRWTPNGSHADFSYGFSLAYAAGKWALGTDAGIVTSDDAVSWTSAANAKLRDRTIKSLAYGNGTWLAGGFPADPSSTDKETVFASTDANNWKPADQTFAPDALTFGGAAAAAGTGSTKPTTPTSASSGGGSSATVACPFHDYDTGALNTFYGPPPASVTLPAGVSLPDDAAVYASGKKVYFVAPEGFNCTAETSEDDTTDVAIADPANAARFVDFGGGGSLQSSTRACPYLASERAAAVANSNEQNCQAPASTIRFQTLPTGSTTTEAVAISVPAGVAASGVPATAGGDGFGTQRPGNDIPTLVLLIVHHQFEGNNFTAGNEAGVSCALPESQRDMCVASLRMVLANSSIGSRSDARAALDKFLAG